MNTITSKPALSLNNVSKQFGQTEIIRNLNLQVHAGERLALIGPNGAGKTSLFNVISGRTKSSAGQIELHGKSIAGRTSFQICRQGLSRSFQVTNIFPQMSVQENCRAAVLWSCGYHYTFWRRLQDVNRKVEILLTQIGLQHQRDTLAMALTYAEQRALEIAITIAADASVILLDEPTAGMNQQESAAMVTMIKAISAHKTLLIIEHDMQVVFDLADRIAVMVAGQIIACDTPEKIRANPVVQAAYFESKDICT